MRVATLVLVSAAVLAPAGATACSYDYNVVFGIWPREVEVPPSARVVVDGRLLRDTTAALVPLDGPAANAIRMERVYQFEVGNDRSVTVFAPPGPLPEGGYRIELFGMDGDWSDGPAHNERGVPLDATFWVSANAPTGVLPSPIVDRWRVRTLGEPGGDSCGVYTQQHLVQLRSALPASPVAWYELSFDDQPDRAPGHALGSRTLYREGTWPQRNPCGWMLTTWEPARCLTVVTVDALGRRSDPLRRCDPDEEVMLESEFDLEPWAHDMTCEEPAPPAPSPETVPDGEDVEDAEDVEDVEAVRRRPDACAAVPGTRDPRGLLALFLLLGPISRRGPARGSRRRCRRGGSRDR